MREPMQLAYFHHLAVGDPALNHAREFADAVTAVGHRISVHAMNGSHGDAPAGPARTSALRGRVSPYLHEFKSLLSNPSYVRRKLAIVAREQPDVIVARHHYLDVSPWLVSRLANKPLVLEMNSPTCERHLFPSAYLRIPWVDDRMEARVVRAASRILVVSGALGRFVINRYGIHPDKVIVNHNGAHLAAHQRSSDRESIIRRLRLSGKKVVGFSGSLHSWRRPDLLLDIIGRFSRRDDVRFLMVGDGPGWATFRTQLEDAGLSTAVTFTGYVDHAVISDYLAAMDVAILPASAFYMSPLKLFEFMAAGVPTVAPRSEAIEEIVSDGETAALFRPGDAEDAASCVERLLDDDSRRRGIGVAAQRRVAMHFTWRHNAERALSACEAAINSAPLPGRTRSRLSPT